jgi:hypothetical protein
VTTSPSSFNINESNYTVFRDKEKFVIKVNSPDQQTDEKIQGIFLRLEQKKVNFQNIQSIEVLTDKNITVNFKDAPKETLDLSSPPTDASSPSVTLKVIKAVDATELLRKRTKQLLLDNPNHRMELLSRLHKKIVKEIDPKLPLAAYLVRYIIAPCIALYRYLSVGKELLLEEQSKSALKKLVASSNPDSMNTFRHLLKRSADIFKKIEKNSRIG